MSYNPRSRIPGILAALDLMVCAYVAARHPLRYLARRWHTPRHAQKVAFVRPIPLTERPYEAPMPVHDVPAAANYGSSEWPPVLVELFDGPIVGGYVGIGGERVAA